MLFPKGAGCYWPVAGTPFVAFASALFAAFRSFVRRRAFVRSAHFRATGSRPSDVPRTPINIDRASRDLAYFFYHLPVERIAWAFPYAPPGLYTQLHLDIIYIYIHNKQYILNIL